LPSFASAIARNEISSCQTLQFCNDFRAAIDYRGFIKVDEVDGRSPVERAAATFVPDLRRHCTVQTTNPASSSSPRSGHPRLNSLTETSIVKFLNFGVQMESTRMLTCRSPGVYDAFFPNAVKSTKKSLIRNYSLVIFAPQIH